MQAVAFPALLWRPEMHDKFGIQMEEIREVVLGENAPTYSEYDTCVPSCRLSLHRCVAHLTSIACHFSRFAVICEHREAWSPIK